jgi:hypothetical protein
LTKIGPDFAFEFFNGRHEAVARDLIHQLPPPPPLIRFALPFFLRRFHD